jgi:hypothetical protein
MNNDDDLEPLVSYFRDNRERFDRATLRRRLLESGYAPNAVRRAEEVVYGPPLAETSGERFFSRTAIGMGALVTTVVLNVVAVPAASTIVGSFLPPELSSLALLPFLAAPLEAIAGVVLLFKYRPAGLGILLGLAISIAIGIVLIGLVLLLVGVCFVILFGGGSH